MMMIRSQRRLILIALPVLACLLHVMLCEWVFAQSLPAPRGGGGVPLQSPQVRLLAFEYSKPLPNSTGAGTFGAVRVTTGLIARQGVSREVAVIGGVLMPVSLMMLWLYLILGWRHASRLQRGLCIACGYDLRGNRGGRGNPGDVRGGDGEHGRDEESIAICTITTCPECGSEQK